MKKIIGLFSLCVAFLSIQRISYAQSGAPNGINYQAVIRDNQGTLVSNSPVAIRINIRQNSASGIVIFSEKHLVTTTQYGLVNFVIGAGTFLGLGGPFATINWGNGPYFLDLGVAFSGLPNPTTYMAYGTQQMMSVPFALYAKSSGNLLNQWKYGTGVPAVNLGTTGDYYLDTATGNVYSKTNGTMWILISNIMGPQGLTGATGPQGIQGLPGPIGATGPIGLTGPAGPQGIQGLPGPIGATGPIGLTGPAGAQGIQGLTGAQGIQGLPGTNGTNGAVGATGPTGLTGPAGVTGAQGIQGLTGPAGATGAQGIQGLPGTNGTNGAVGATGPAGTNGQSAYQAAVTNGFVGTEAQWLTSLQGIQGLTGPTGATGAQGIQGLPGTIGAAGATGPVGLTGATGAQGIQGLPGTNGANGATGPTGLTGLTGATGAQGIQGLPGTNGTNGAVGATGPAGAQGIQGLPGTNGTNGAVGATGPAGTNGQSAYQVAVTNGFVGTEAQWLTSLQGIQGLTGPTGVTGAQGPVGLTGPVGQQGATGAVGPVGPSGAINNGVAFVNYSLQTFLGNVNNNNSYSHTGFKVDTQGNLIVLGVGNGNIIFGGITHTNISANNNNILTKIDSTGSVIWSILIPGGIPGFRPLDIDSQNNIYLGCQGILYKYSTNGILIWQMAVDGNRTFAIKIDNQDNAVAFGGNAVSQFAGGGSGKIRKYTSQGVLLWTWNVALNDQHYGNGGDLALDNINNVYYSFSRIGGNNGPQYAGMEVHKLNSNGTLAWTTGTVCNNTTVFCPSPNTPVLSHIGNGILAVIGTPASIVGTQQNYIKLSDLNGSVMSQIDNDYSANQQSMFFSISKVKNGSSYQLVNEAGAQSARLHSISKYDGNNIVRSVFAFENTYSSVNFAIDFNSNGSAFILGKAPYSGLSLSPSLSFVTPILVTGNSGICIIKFNP